MLAVIILSLCAMLFIVVRILDALLPEAPTPKPKRPLRATYIRHVGPRNELIVILSDGSSWRGSGTVWHAYPQGKRAETWMESLLNDVWVLYLWEQEKQREKGQS